MSNIICPLCGTTTSFEAATVEGEGILVGYSDKTETRWGQVKISAIVPHDAGWSPQAYAILVCQSCGEYIIAKKERSSDDWYAVYPITHKTIAEEIPEHIKGVYEEANLCFSIDAYGACLLMSRTTLISMQREQDVKNLNELKEKGAISNTLLKQANQVRLWANMVGHEDIIPEDITKEDCEQLLAYLNALLDAIYVQPVKLTNITSKLSKLKKKE